MLDSFLPDLPRPSTARNHIIEAETAIIQQRLQDYRDSLELPENAFLKATKSFEYVE